MEFKEYIREAPNLQKGFYRFDDDATKKTTFAHYDGKTFVTLGDEDEYTLEQMQDSFSNMERVKTKYNRFM